MKTLIILSSKAFDCIPRDLLIGTIEAYGQLENRYPTFFCILQTDIHVLV